MAVFAPGSFRDRDARVLIDTDGVVWRAMSQHASTEWSKFEASSVCRPLMDQGVLIHTRRDQPAHPDPQWSCYVRHERVPCITYPFEWPFGLLKRAASLHLDLLLQLMDADFTLKDGTAYNVQFRGIEPVMIDVSSIETLDPTHPWRGYRQFCQTMLFPLMLQAYKNLPFQPFLRGRLDGITATEMSRLMSVRDCFRRGVWSHIKLHAWLERSSSTGGVERQVSSSSGRFSRSMLQANFQGLRNLIDRLHWKPGESQWSEYEATHTYSPEDRQKKEEFVRVHISRQKRNVVWDLGCNTGAFSRIAAGHSDLVLAMDADQLSVERLFHSLESETGDIRRKILPLVWNVADQSRGLGWRGQERTELTDRSRPDFILSLALIHHLVIGGGIPMSELLSWFASLRGELLVEFVHPEDEMAAGLLKSRAGPCPDYQWDCFMSELQQHFEVREMLNLCQGKRTLVMASPRQ